MGTNKYCIKCGYNLPSSKFTRCPECGASLRNKEASANNRNNAREDKRKQKAIKPRWQSVLLRSFFIAMLLLFAFLVYGSCVGESTLALLPYTVLLAVLVLLICPFLYYFIVVLSDCIKSIRNLRRQVGIKWTLIMIAVVIVFIFGIFIVPRLLAQRDVDYAASICSEYGISSSECSAIQRNKSVSCSQNGLLYIECRKDYSVAFPIFY